MPGGSPAVHALSPPSRSWLPVTPAYRKLETWKGRRIFFALRLSLLVHGMAHVLPTIRSEPPFTMGVEGAETAGGIGAKS